jgi:hypothetical protein
MLAAHTASFLKFIDSVLEDISQGIASRHHLHNVRCGIENILALLEFNNEVDERANELSRRAQDYIMYRDSLASEGEGGSIGDDCDRLRIVREALDGFRFAVEHSKPNSRVRALGLAS